MRKKVWGLLLACAAWSSVYPAGKREVESSHSCKYDLLKAHGTSGWVQIDLKNGQVDKLEFSGRFPVRGDADFHCTIAADRSKSDQAWKNSGRSVTIEFKRVMDPEHDLVKIFRKNNGYLVDLSEASSVENCGTAAELPERVFVPLSSGRCKVKLRYWTVRLGE